MTLLRRHIFSELGCGRTQLLVSGKKFQQGSLLSIQFSELGGQSPVSLRSTAPFKRGHVPVSLCIGPFGKGPYWFDPLRLRAHSGPLIPPRAASPVSARGSRSQTVPAPRLLGLAAETQKAPRTEAAPSSAPPSTDGRSSSHTPGNRRGRPAYPAALRSARTSWGRGGARSASWNSRPCTAPPCRTGGRHINPHCTGRQGGSPARRPRPPQADGGFFAAGSGKNITTLFTESNLSRG